MVTSTSSTVVDVLVDVLDDDVDDELDVVDRGTLVDDDEGTDVDVVEDEVELDGAVDVERGSVGAVVAVPPGAAVVGVDEPPAGGEPGEAGPRGDEGVAPAPVVGAPPPAPPTVVDEPPAIGIELDVLSMAATIAETIDMLASVDVVPSAEVVEPPSADGAVWGTAVSEPGFSQTERALAVPVSGNSVSRTAHDPQNAQPSTTTQLDAPAIERIRCGRGDLPSRSLTVTRCEPVGPDWRTIGRSSLAEGRNAWIAI